jgi:hypothetical protein
MSSKKPAVKSPKAVQSQALGWPHPVALPKFLGGVGYLKPPKGTRFILQSPLE